MKARSFTTWGVSIAAASPVTVGDGVGAAGSAVLNLNAAMSAAQALNVTLASDGVVVQNSNRLVRLSAVSGTGELRLNNAWAMRLKSPVPAATLHSAARYRVASGSRPPIRPPEAAS